MRNKHRPPDQQDPLLRSSDSEEDEKVAAAERSRQKAELENGAADDLWNEVSGEHTEQSEHSATSSSSDNDSGGSQADHMAEKLSNRNNIPLEGRPKVLYEAESGDVESIKKLVEAKDDEKKPEDVEEKAKPQAKRILIEEAKLEEINITKTEAESANLVEDSAEPVDEVESSMKENIEESVPP